MKRTMAEENDPCAPVAPKATDSGPKAASGAAPKKNAAALAAALRANLGRRKARERALRDAERISDSEG